MPPGTDEKTPRHRRDESRLVDTEVRRVIHDAAMLRLKLVQEAERDAEGVSRTTLAKVGRDILLAWHPDMPVTPTVPAPRGSRKGHQRADHVIAVRFSMALGVYQPIRDRIHACDLSVASVLNYGYKHFAKTGTIPT